MSDLLRGTAGFESFSNALSVHLVELSPALRQLQYRALRWVLAGWARVGEGQIIVCRVA
jgi:SAM-dependent MidA family methyltransferase